MAQRLCRLHALKFDLWLLLHGFTPEPGLNPTADRGGYSPSHE
jgi:hypothetical protein